MGGGWLLYIASANDRLREPLELFISIWFSTFSTVTVHAVGVYDVAWDWSQAGSALAAREALIVILPTREQRPIDL